MPVQKNSELRGHKPDTYQVISPPGTLPALPAWVPLHQRMSQQRGQHVTSALQTHIEETNLCVFSRAPATATGPVAGQNMSRANITWLLLNRKVCLAPAWKKESL